MSLFEPTLLGHRLTFWTITIAAGVVNWNLLTTLTAFQYMAVEPFSLTTNDVGDDVVIVIRHIVNLEIVSDVFPKNIGDFDF